MSNQQKEGMSLIEQGFLGIITSQMQPEIDKINKEISESKETFNKIKSEADKTLDSVKNSVDNAIKQNIKEIKDDLDNRSTRTHQGISSLESRLAEIEKKIEGQINYSLHVNDSDKSTALKYEFVFPEKEEIQGIRYFIDGSERYAKVENGIAKGVFIKDSKIEKGYGFVTFEKQIDKGKETLQLELKRESYIKKLDSLEKLILKMQEQFEEQQKFRSSVEKYLKETNAALESFMSSIKK